MAFGKGKRPQSYGVPVRPVAPPVLPEQAAYPQPVSTAAGSWTSAPAPPAGFYAPVVAAPVPAAAHFAPAYPAAPPAGTAYAPYAPAPYAQQPDWTPAGYPAPPGYGVPAPSNTVRNVAIGAGVVIAVLFLLGILLAVAIPVFLNQRGPVKAPTTLAGRSLIATPETTDIAATAADAMSKQNSGRRITVAMYGVTDEPDVMLIAMRGRVDESREVEDAKQAGIVLDRTTRREYDGVVCYQIPQYHGAMCMWSRGSVAGWLHVYGDADTDSAASIALEARKVLG